jgi:hypothetical protein
MTNLMRFQRSQENSSGDFWPKNHRNIQVNISDLVSTIAVREIYVHGYNYQLLDRQRTMKTTKFRRI